MYEFNYHKASSVTDAEQALTNCSEGKLLAGGQTLLPTLKQRLASPSDLVDLGGCSELKGIVVDGNMVTIGAMTTHAVVASSPEIRSAIPALADLAGNIGDAQVRNRGTIGGSIANNDPAADYPAACLGLGATIVTDKREMSADDFFTGLFETALDEREIITAVRFPKPDKASYQKFANPASRYALVGVMVAKTSGGVRFVVTGAGADGVFRADVYEAALKGSFDPSALDIEPIHMPDLLSDIHGSAAYRENLIRVLGKRAVTACG